MFLGIALCFVLAVYLVSRSESYPVELSHHDALQALNEESLAYKEIGFDEQDALSFEHKEYLDMQTLGDEVISVFGLSVESLQARDYMGHSPSPSADGETNSDGETSSMSDEERVETDFGELEDKMSADDDLDWQYQEEEQASDGSFSVSGSSILPEEHAQNIDERDLDEIHDDLMGLQLEMSEHQFDLHGSSVSDYDLNEHTVSSEDDCSHTDSDNSVENNSPTEETVFGQSVVAEDYQDEKGFPETAVGPNDWYADLDIPELDVTLSGQSVVNRHDQTSHSNDFDGASFSEGEDDYIEQGYDLDVEERSFEVHEDVDREEWPINNTLETDHFAQGDEVDEKAEAKHNHELHVEGQSVVSKHDHLLPDYVMEVNNYPEYPGMSSGHSMEEELLVTGQSPPKEPAHEEYPFADPVPDDLFML